jgi:hypothetical protein
MKTTADNFEIVEFMGSKYYLPLSELRRHALVSTRNRHYCNSCFCCACVDKIKELRAAEGGGGDDE